MIRYGKRLREKILTDVATDNQHYQYRSRFGVANYESTLLQRTKQKHASRKD